MAVSAGNNVYMHIIIYCAHVRNIVIYMCCLDDPITIRTMECLFKCFPNNLEVLILLVNFNSCSLLYIV